MGGPVPLPTPRLGEPGPGVQGRPGRRVAGLQQQARCLLQTHQTIVVQLLQSTMRLLECPWLQQQHKGSVEACIRTLAMVGECPGALGSPHHRSPPLPPPGDACPPSKYLIPKFVGQLLLGGAP